MIQEIKTNHLYISDQLKIKYPNFYKVLLKELGQLDIIPEYIPGTKDVWAVDYMPIQINEKEFIRFHYNPDYLREFPDQRISPPELDRIIINIQKKDAFLSNSIIKNSKIIIDGGNVIKSTDKVIMCDKVLHENNCYSKKVINKLIDGLEQLFKVDKIILVPWEPEDFTGHADGMVRIINDDTVLINEYSKYENDEYQISLRMAIHNAGLDYLELPCFLPDDPTGTSVRGLYLNYLQMKQGIFMPTFKLKSDDKAYRTLCDVFKGQHITTIESSDLAREGGVLNCITWNIKK